uniref:G-protein coupled receptors family 1 profile domain-containing protein n=1 Tax=Romanomermis culicivorax TaxID=13658 RepID=A0A915J7F2_ROMCU
MRLTEPVFLAYLCAGPFFVVYLLTGTWSFGRLICRLSYICEGLNKTMSIYLLVILSGDRYLAACRPTSSFRYRTIRTAVYSIICLIAFVFFTNLPIYWYTDVHDHTQKCSQCGIWFPSMLIEKANSSVSYRNQIQKTANIQSKDRENFNYNKSSSFENEKQLVSTSTTSAINFDSSTTKNLEHFYFVFLLFVYFIVPAVLIIGFYTKIVLRIRQKGGKLFGGQKGSKNCKKCSDEQSSEQDYILWKLTSTSSTTKHIPSDRQNYRSNKGIERSRRKHKITKSVSLVVSLYFLCWTPYWILVMITLWSKTASVHSTTFVFFATTVHLMPYVNSCVDPILYAFLNKRLWAAYNFEKNRKRRNFVSSFRKSNFLMKKGDEKFETSDPQQRLTQFSSSETPSNNALLSSANNINSSEHVDPIFISIQRYTANNRRIDRKTDEKEDKNETLIVFSPDIDQEL